MNARNEFCFCLLIYSTVFILSIQTPQLFIILFLNPLYTEYNLQHLI